jgi:hypothetical protein
MAQHSARNLPEMHSAIVALQQKAKLEMAANVSGPHDFF